MFIRSKYSSKVEYVNGVKFHSKKEAKRYQELKILEAAGEIEGLELQPRYHLLPSFKYKGKSIRGIDYIADFRYRCSKTGKVVIEDVKGFKTKDYILKKKMLLKKIVDNKLEVEFDFREV